MIALKVAAGEVEKSVQSEHLIGFDLGFLNDIVWNHRKGTCVFDAVVRVGRHGAFSFERTNLR